MIGGLIMVHGDDRGLRIPPRLAHVQAVVMVIRDDDGVGEAAAAITAELKAAGVRVRLDDRTDTAFGRRATDWELKGVPVRIEVGPRDLANGEVTVVRRDSSEKSQASLAGVAATVPALLQPLVFIAIVKESAALLAGVADRAGNKPTAFVKLPGDAARDAVFFNCPL